MLHAILSAQTKYTCSSLHLQSIKLPDPFLPAYFTPVSSAFCPSLLMHSLCVPKASKHTHLQLIVLAGHALVVQALSTTSTLFPPRPYKYIL